MKLPVPPGERQWLTRLQAFDQVVPRLWCHGENLGGYDMAWIVMERLAHGPLGTAWAGKEFDLLVEAAGRFYAAAATFEPGPPSPPKDWRKMLSIARQNVRARGFPQQQRWNQALKKAQQKLKRWLKIWEDRSTEHWCHGDLHLRNAMTRVRAPGGPAVLFDLALTHSGHWVEDAIYFEHLYWGNADRLKGRKLATMIAHQRKTVGLPVDSDWSRLADVRRALTAMTTPARLASDGHPRQLLAALELLEAST